MIRDHVHVWPHEKRSGDGRVTLSATIELPARERHELW